MTNHLFEVIDTKAKEFNKREKAAFETQEKAEEYIENHERPEDLICNIDPSYSKSYLERFEKEFRLNKTDIEILELINLKNIPETIEKIMKKDINVSLQKLRNNAFIDGYYSDLKITDKGKNFLARIKSENEQTNLSEMQNK